MESKIAILFMSNRFSQKLGKRVNIHHKYTNYVTVPINMRKITNPNTIVRKLKEYDYVVLHSSDVDLIEKLTELKINFFAMKYEYSDNNYHRLKFDDLYLKTQIKKFLGIVVKQKVYYINGENKVGEKEVTIDTSIDRDYYFDTPKEAVNNRITYLNSHIDNYKYWVEHYTNILNQVKENCKEYL